LDCKDTSYEPIMYWKATFNHFLTLASMAQSYLFVPASSPAKRAFSAGCPSLPEKLAHQRCHQYGQHLKLFLLSSDLPFILFFL
ncbi:hypothetical protein VP01_1329g8, partial [Puccinia sorghi]